MNEKEQLNELEKAFVSYVKCRLDGRSLRLKKKTERLYNNELLILNEPLNDEEESVEKIDQMANERVSLPEQHVVNKLSIENAMFCLTEKESFIIRKIFWEQGSVKELCRELGISKNTVLKTKRNALEKMKKTLVS